jgi:hypothetical protein
MINPGESSKKDKKQYSILIQAGPRAGFFYGPFLLLESCSAPVRQTGRGKGLNGTFLMLLWYFEKYMRGKGAGKDKKLFQINQLKNRDVQKNAKQVYALFGEIHQV